MAEDLSFDIYLESEGEDGTQFRTTRNRPNEVQRKHIVNRAGALIVQGELVETVHGQLEEDGEPASLVVFDFRVLLKAPLSMEYDYSDFTKFETKALAPVKLTLFYSLQLYIQFLSGSSSRRIKEAKIIVTFGDDRGRPDDGPDVIKVAPEGAKGYYVTSKQVELKHGVNASVSGGGGPASLSAGYTLERATSQSLQDQIKVTGVSQFSDERTVGEHNQAIWLLSENKSQKTGIPSHLRALVLLQRQEKDVDARFTATIEISTEVDFSLGDKMKMLGGKKDRDDPIIFDPRPEAQPRKFKWAKENQIDAGNLDGVSLEEYQLVATMERLSS